jgi:hypothetical protein
MAQAVGADKVTTRRLVELAGFDLYEVTPEQREVASGLSRDIDLARLLFQDARLHHEAHNFRATNEEELRREFVAARDLLERIARIDSSEVSEEMRALQVHSHVRLYDLYGAAENRNTARTHANFAWQLQVEMEDADAQAEAVRVFGLAILETDPFSARECFAEARAVRRRSSLSDAWWDVLESDDLRAEVTGTNRPVDIERRASALTERLHDNGVHWAALSTRISLAHGLWKFGNEREARRIIVASFEDAEHFPDVALRVRRRLRELAARIDPGLGADWSS